GAADHAADGRPVSGTRLQAAGRQRTARRPGCLRAGDRVDVIRGRLRAAHTCHHAAPGKLPWSRELSPHRNEFATSRATEFVDVTDRIREAVRRSGLRDGRVHLQSLHTTLGIAVNENEPLLHRDFESMLERLAPTGAGYEHDDFTRRFDIPLDEPVNGHAHCRQLLLSAFATLLVEDGQLLLGRWQSVFAVELDGPRHRQLALQVEGEFAASHVPAVPESLVELELARQLMVDPEPVAAPMRRLVEAG